MSRLKYIVIDGVSPVLFGETLTHKSVARIAGDLPITGAGFCSVTQDLDSIFSVTTYGKSVSLGDKGPHEHDAALIQRLFE